MKAQYYTFFQSFLTYIISSRVPEKSQIGHRQSGGLVVYPELDVRKLKTKQKLAVFYQSTERCPCIMKPFLSLTSQINEVRLLIRPAMSPQRNEVLIRGFCVLRTLRSRLHDHGLRTLPTTLHSSLVLSERKMTNSSGRSCRLSHSPFLDKNHQATFLKAAAPRSIPLFGPFLLPSLTTKVRLSESSNQKPALTHLINMPH